MSPATASRMTLALLMVAVLMGGVILGSAVTAFGDNAGPTPKPSPTPITSPSASTGALPEADVDGEDLERLPRYPGSVRSEYGVSRDDRYRLTAVEYLVDSTVEEVRVFYLTVMDDHGWDRADIAYSAGEWTYVLVDGRTEALIEIEEWNGLIEIDLQISEVIETPTPQPTPEPTQEPTPRPPAAPPPPAPQPAPPEDDDDDDDDSDDWSDWGWSDG